MNIIIAILEFMVLFMSIVLFTVEKTNDGKNSWQWTLALVITVILMILMNIGTICRGLNWCIGPCGTAVSPDVEAAKEAVAAYRRVKAGGDPKAGLFDFSSVDLNKLNKDSEEKLIFRNLKPAQVAQVANTQVDKLLRNRIQKENEAGQEQIRENLALAQKQQQGILPTPVRAPPLPTNNPSPLVAQLKNQKKNLAPPPPNYAPRADNRAAIADLTGQDTGLFNAKPQGPSKVALEDTPLGN